VAGDDKDIRAQINAKLAPLGLTFDQLLPVFQPMVTAAVKEVLEEMKLPEILNASVAKGVDARMGVYVAQLNEKIAGAAPEVVTPGQPQEKQPPAGGGFNLGALLANPQALSVILNMLGFSPKPTEGVAGLSQLADFAKAFGAINTAFVTPILEAQESGRRTALAQIGMLAKTGSKMPWDTDDKKPT